MDMEHKALSDLDGLTRLAVCVVVAVAAVYAVEKLCEGNHLPLWEKYGPWITGNKLQAIAVLAAALYALSLAVWPQKEEAPEEGGFTPCE